MLADFDIAGLSNDMKIAVQKKSFRRSNFVRAPRAIILYRIILFISNQRKFPLIPIKKL